ncbi:MAG TPA: hypothetical protein GX704_01805 [Clostridiales bacterium]|nr:hypothetical protein [Clostridiales bacterium]
MRLIKSRPCLALPISNNMPAVRVTFSAGGDDVWELDCRLDFENPAYTIPLDFSRFFGDADEIELQISPDFEFEDCELVKSEYDELYRPQLRFSPMYGWTNDPNGLCFYKGLYHMFFQHNPAGTTWGNMHWGHATSEDLTHWTEHKIALYPDPDAHTIFSGCAIVDHDNVSGLGKKNNPAMLLFYTGAGQPFEQRLAYTTDGFTFHRYESGLGVSGTAVVPHIRGDNRDPKVIWCEELSKFVMALYLADNTFTLLTSSNLLDWTRLQDIELPGDAECPDFYPLEADDGSRRWVLSGASGHYYVGEFKKGRAGTGLIFEPTQGWRSFQPTGGAGDPPTLGYAAQTFSDEPKGRRIRICWQRVSTPNGAVFNQNMSFPHEVKLVRERSGGFRLTAQPINEITLLITDRGHALRADFDVVSNTDASLMLRGVKIPLPKGEYRATVLLDGNSWERYIPALGDVCSGVMPTMTPPEPKKRSSRRKLLPLRPIYTTRDKGGYFFERATVKAYGEKALESVWKKPFKAEVEF